MNTTRKLLICIVVLFSVFQLGFVSADRLNKMTTVTLADLNYEQDDTVRGTLVTQDYWFQWPSLWEPTAGNTFTLEFAHSPVLDPNSTLTIEFNNVSLGSVAMTTNNADEGRLSVEIPAEIIQPGFNQLRINFFMGLRDFDCVDEEDPSVWATIRDTSSFQFSYDLITPEADLSAFPAPFIEPGALAQNQVNLVLPDNPDMAELEAAVAVSAKLGQFAKATSAEINTFVQGDLNSPPEGFTIYVGKADRLDILADEGVAISWDASASSLVDHQGETIEPDAGVLWQQVSPYDDSALSMIVTGATDEAIKKAGRALAHQDAYRLMPGPLGVIEELPELETDTSYLGQQMSLEALGYQNQTAYGTREQNISTYTIPLNQAWQFVSDAQFELHFAHSTMPDPETSFLSLLLNDTPVGSIQLGPENAEDAFHTFTLPKELFRPGENTLTINSNMQLEQDYDDDRVGCQEDDNKAAWVVVYNDSNVTLPGGTSGPLRLSNYPQAFIGPNNLSETAFVLADRENSIIVRGVLDLAFEIGQATSARELLPSVLDAADQAERDRGPKHQILVGLPSEHAQISGLNEELPQPFQPGTNIPERLDAVALIISEDDHVGYLQSLLKDDGKTYLIVTGTSYQGIEKANAVLSDNERLDQLDGDLVIIKRADSLASFSIQDEETLQPSVPSGATVIESPRVSENQTIRLIAIALFVVTIVILAALLVLDIYRSIRREE